MKSECEMRLNDPGKCTTFWSIILSVYPSGSWQIDQTLPYPDANNVTPLNCFTFFVLGGYSVWVMNIDRWPAMWVVHLQSKHQSLDDAFELPTIQWFWINVVRVKVVSVDAFAAVLAAFGGLPCCFLKQFTVICPSCWQWKNFRRSFSFLLSVLSPLSSPLSPLGLLPPLPAL